jgi:hypothetical protein
MEEVRAAVKEYGPELTYNMDESGYNWRMKLIGLSQHRRPKEQRRQRLESQPTFAPTQQEVISCLHGLLAQQNGQMSFELEACGRLTILELFGGGISQLG